MKTNTTLQSMLYLASLVIKTVYRLRSMWPANTVVLMSVDYFESEAAMEHHKVFLN